MLAKNTMHNRNWPLLDIVYDNITDLDTLVTVPQEQDISTLECGFHGSRQHHDNWGWGVGDNGKTLVKHVGCGQDHRQVECLRQHLTHRHVRKLHFEVIGVLEWRVDVSLASFG